MLYSYARRTIHARPTRIAITAVLLVAATVIAVVFGNAGHPSRAVAATLRPVEKTASSFVSDRQLIIESAPLRAVVAAQQAAQAKAAMEREATASMPALDVWTAGWQTQINACRGGVDLTSHYGTRTVAQHWQCGGSSFPTAAGTTVSFAGLDAGTYRVIGVVAILNAYVARTSQIPRGYDMLFQTCRSGDSHTTEFIALQKVG